MAFYLGLDAGGTKTECALAQDNTILARAASGTIKLMRTSSEEAGKHLDEVLGAVSAEANIKLNAIACTCVGLAGISVPSVRDWVRQGLAERVGGQVFLCGDEEAALDAAFFGGPGVLVVAGTGSNIVARSTAGELMQVGGWGPAVADEGSGSWIGKQAVRKIFHALDRGEQSQLLGIVLEAWNLQDIPSLIDRANQVPGPDFSKLTPLVVRCAGKGNREAKEVLQQAGEELGRLARLALRRLQAAERGNIDHCEVAFTGSVLQHVAAVRETMCATIHREFPGVRVRETAVDPIEGALWRARESYLGNR